MANTLKNKISLSNRNSGTIFVWLGKIINPQKNWIILIIIFIILILTSLGFDFNYYQQIVSGDMYVDINRADLSIQSLKKNELQNILDNFEAKKTSIATLKAKNLVDPSI